MSVSSSPRVFSNYHKKRPIVSGNRSPLDEESEAETSQSSEPKTSSARNVVGLQFFGPDFNVETAKGKHTNGNLVYFSFKNFFQ